LNNKIKSFFSIALIGILSLSILAIAAPVMADTCSLSIGVQSDSSYTKDESFEVCGWITNNENRRVDYTMNLNLYGPNGGSIISETYIRSIMPRQTDEFIIIKPPPEEGWNTGEYELCNAVIAQGINGCVYYDKICRTFTVISSDKPDLLITRISETLEDGTLSVTSTVKNIGEVGADASMLGIYIDNTLIGTNLVGELAAGMIYNCTVIIDPFNGPCDSTVTVKVCADDNNIVDESDENNNCLTSIWMCGDGNGDGIVNILDVRLLMNHVSHPGYPVNSWAGDVTGNGVIDNDDVRLLVKHVFDSDAYLLQCGCN